MKEYEPLLLERPEFLRVHRSYIVNMLQISALSPTGIRTFSGKTLPVSRLLYTQVQKDYMDLLFTGQELCAQGPSGPFSGVDAAPFFLLTNKRSFTIMSVNERLFAMEAHTCQIPRKRF